MGKSYDNEIVVAETSLSIETLLIGPSTATWNPTTGRVDVASPPTGFSRLGAVVEDTPTLAVKREKYQLKLGLPRALQYEAVIGVDGEFTTQMYAKSNEAVQYGTGTDIVTLTTIGSRLSFGRTTIKKYALIGVADFTDGSQVVHYFPTVSVKTDYSEAHRPTDAGKIALGFDCYSHISTIHGSERIVGERIYFPPTA